jgi:hypothetical protein
MALVNAVGGAYSAASVKNNAGTVVKGGTPASDSPIQNVLGLNTLADDRGESFGSKVVANDGTGANTTDRAGVTKAVSGGTLAYKAGATEWVVRGGNVSTTLGGVANTQLIGGGRDYSGQLNDDATEVARTKIADVKIGSYATQGFDMLARPSTNINPNRSGSGTDGKGVGAGSAQTYVNPADGTAAVASEIAPSRSVPGELTYFFGELAVATTDEYKASNVAES